MSPTQTDSNLHYKLKAASSNTASQSKVMLRNILNRSNSDENNNKKTVQCAELFRFEYAFTLINFDTLTCKKPLRKERALVEEETPHNQLQAYTQSIALYVPD